MEKRANIILTLEQGLAVTNDLQPDRSSAELARILGVSQAYLLRRSVDARKRGKAHFVVTAGVGGGEGAPQAVMSLMERPVPSCHNGSDNVGRVLVAGSGPAGLFAALELAEAGYAPLLVERGAAVEQRSADIAEYQATRRLNTASNVQFGEGGAGTFSDGKLTCGKNSPYTTQVLETFVAAGASPEILWQAKPHMGTDVLQSVVKTIRQRIIACGGEVRFNTQLTDVEVRRGKLSAVYLASQEGIERLEARRLVLACGHSARDTFEMLLQRGFAMEPKPFSMGVRIEHPQRIVDRSQYKMAQRHPALGPADYKLNVHLPNGRGVYSFCMCPGGEVVAASSEEGGLCVNGMSYRARAGVNANAALLCSVNPQDFAKYGSFEGDPLAGVAFQRAWEQAAFKAGGSDWHAPASMVGSFLKSKKKPSFTVEPSYPMGVCETDLRRCLPEFVSESLAQSLPLLGRKLAGYDDPGALMTGIEARSSSPVRVIRNGETLQSVNVEGVFPCGEGCGYAGGIMSAAIDGIRVAQKACQLDK